MEKWLRDTDLQHAIVQEEESQVSIPHPEHRVPNAGSESGVNIRNRYNFSWSSLAIFGHGCKDKSLAFEARGASWVASSLVQTLVSHAMRHRIRMQDTSWQFPTEDGGRDCRHCKHAY